MSVTTVNIELDEEAARTYSNATVEEQKKLRMLFGLWLREFEDRSISLEALMDSISDKAQERGLTLRYLSF